jgi:hypothetical protein
MRLVEAPYRLRLHVLFKALARKAQHDSLFCSTLLNTLGYLPRRDLGLRVSARLTRRSYWESNCKHGLKAT